MVDAAIDNFDQNENTIDGKHTTHSMAMVLFQRSASPVATQSVRRTTAKTFTATEFLEDIPQRYKKPHKRPEPPAVADDRHVRANPNFVAPSKSKDLLWALTRFMNRQKITVPAWGGFNALTSEEITPVATIRYLPFIPAPPSDLSTIFTALNKLVAIAEKLGQPHIMVTADLAIYSKAQEILWTKPKDLVGKVTMRLGGMHLLMAYIAGIGKVFGDGGLLQLLSYSGVYAESSARLMLQGKQLDRSVRGIKLVFEALMFMYLESAQSWCETQGIELIDAATKKCLSEVPLAVKSDEQELASIIDQIDTSRVQAVLDQFRNAGRSQSSTFLFWDTFLDAVFIMLRLLRAERNADFELHLNAVCETIPFFFVSGRSNYAKFAPIYVAEMRSLKDQQPDAYRHLQRGGFVVRRSKRVFNCVATDQALEQTVNREAKSKGGVVGFTLREGALTRWLLTRQTTGSYSEAIRRMSIPMIDIRHEDLGESMYQRDLADVDKIVDVLQNQFQDPFDLHTVPSDLINIATGQVATKEVQQSLTTLQEKGSNLMTTFIDKRMKAQVSRTSFWAPQRRHKLHTFADMIKPLPYDKKKKIMCSPEVLFRRLLAVSSSRNIDLQQVLQHELAAVPPTLFCEDGSMRKTTKADLQKKLETFCMSTPILPPAVNTTTVNSSALVIDGMAMIQSLNESLFKTFDELCQQVLKKILQDGSRQLGTEIVTVVFDRYDNTKSIKGAERQRRGSAATIKRPTHQLLPSRNVPKYREFLKTSGNKAELADFVSNFISTHATTSLQENETIVLAGGFADGKMVKAVNSNGTTCMPSMFSNQEEADTRMILHAIDLSRSHKRIIIRCDDTDVLVILLYYYSRGLLSSEVFMQAGHCSKHVHINASFQSMTLHGNWGPVFVRPFQRFTP